VSRSIRARSPPRFRRTDRVMRELFSPLVDRVVLLVRSLGPYAAIELTVERRDQTSTRQQVVSPEGEPHCVISPIAVRTPEDGPVSDSFFARNPREIEPEIPRSWRLRGQGLEM
jgi:hypothetical protein